MERAAECEPVEWEQLRVVGKPLLSGAALGATPLMWVACRAQPCLVHIFSDTQLQEVWRFPSDPVFLLIGSGSSLEGRGEHVQCAACLLVITQDGCIWIVKLSKTTASISRPSKRQKTKNLGEIYRMKPILAKPTITEVVSAAPSGHNQTHVPPIDGAEEFITFRYEDSSEDGWRLSNHGHSQTPPSFATSWRALPAKSYAPSQKCVEVKNVVVAETLLGTIPGAKVAAFGLNNYVIVVASFGSPELLHCERLTPTRLASHPESPASRCLAPVFRGEPTCLLVVSSARSGQKHGPPKGQALLSQLLFESISSPTTGADRNETLLLQGALDGKVYTFQVLEGALIDNTPRIICDLQQPVVAIFPVSYPVKIKGCASESQATKECDETTGANWLLVIGQLGQVALFSSVRDEVREEEIDSSPFLQRHLQNPVGLGSKNQPVSILKTLVRREGEIKEPITSACLLGVGSLCYTIGSEVFITDLLKNCVSNAKDGGVSAGVKCSRNNSKSMLIDSLHLSSLGRVLVRNVAAISGPGLFTYRGVRPLLVLTRSGSLQSVRVFEQFASSDEGGSIRTGQYQDNPKGYSDKRVEVLLQSIADAESCRDNLQTHERALTLAMNELALALPRARDIATAEMLSLPANMYLGSSTNLAVTGLGCTLIATPTPSTSLGSGQLSFGGVGIQGLRETSNLVARTACNKYKTCLDVSLMNHSRTPLSQYWSIIVELQSCLSSVSPTLHFSLNINNNQGLPVGSQWNHKLYVRLPGGPWSPVMATVYLCHIHDYHKALLRISRDSQFERSEHGSGKTSSAACVVLLRQRVDLFSLLQIPLPTVGHTSWTPSLSGKVNLRARPFHLAGMDGVEVLDFEEADILSSFSESLAWRSSLEAKHTGGRSMKLQADWQSALFRHVLQKASGSTGRKMLKLAAQGGDMIAISMDTRAEQGGGTCLSVINIQTPCLLLGILFRESLLWHLSIIDDEGLTGDRNIEMTQSSKSRKEWYSRVEALVRRGRTVFNLWKKFERPHAPATEDLVVPLLGHTYGVAGEIIQAYKGYREEGSSSLL